MGKSTKKKNKKITAPKANIQELSISRDGGQIALRGYSYQFLYSCYLILSSSNPSNFFQLEGIEDIDCIMQKNGSNDITHIQLKYSVNKQDASFLTDVLKNFLEAYLLDQNRFFKLVYDFPVAKGHLSKIFASKLDEKSRTHWAGVISNIKKNNPSWNWSVYDFDKFISHLSFEKIEKSILATEIEKTLIRIYEINTDNVSLFANSIKILCFEKMEQRAYVTKAELDSKIQSVKIDISKGPQNPAHSWIRKLDYSKPSIDEGCSFYEGKKATPADIVSGFPIKRPSLEKDVINSICENMVTVIKASSGQGKTTLALRAAYILQNEYIPYQLLWCDEIKEIGNIVQYFKARIQLGEKILILIDNLDNHLSKWNYLVQLLQSELHCHYKLLITSREMDWYNYSGDLSNIQSLKVIKPVLEEKEAIEIFNLFREAKQLHPSITSWQRAWNKIAERQLLIEYSLLDKLVPPYPVNVTAQMLDCFSEKYDLPEKKVTDVDELPIGYIAEELWIYSKSVELLTEPEDACYLAAQTQDIQLNITEMLCLLKNKLPVKDVDWLIEICDNVFSGEKFDDIMFNNVIEHFIQKKIEQ